MVYLPLPKRKTFAQESDGLSVLRTGTTSDTVVHMTSQHPGQFALVSQKVQARVKAARTEAKSLQVTVELLKPFEGGVVFPVQVSDNFQDLPLRMSRNSLGQR
eukprot:6442529-Pyramimonas_sp.AAC.1